MYINYTSVKYCYYKDGKDIDGYRKHGLQTKWHRAKSLTSEIFRAGGAGRERGRPHGQRSALNTTRAGSGLAPRWKHLGI